jgi:hypothetical protein
MDAVFRKSYISKLRKAYVVGGKLNKAIPCPRGQQNILVKN